MPAPSSRLTHLLLGAVVALLVADRAAPRPAHAGEAGSSQLFAVTAPGVSPGNNTLFVVDPTTDRLLVYEHRAGGALELVTVRNMTFDGKFDWWPPEGDRVTVPPVARMKEDYDKQTRSPPPPPNRPR